MTLSLIVAAAENGVIGRQGQMPWRIPSDLKTFRSLTLGKPVIMGRKTYQSIGKALDGRLNIVVSRDAAFAANDASVVADFPAALALATSDAGTTGEVMVIGGAEIYRLAMPLTSRIYLTRVHAQPDGDAYFHLPATGWRVVSSTPIPRATRDDFTCTLMILERQST